MSDARALEWLDRLLEADETGREASLRALASTDPELHARLHRLLRSALEPDNTRLLANPVLDGVARLSLDATRGLRPGDVLAGYRLIREIGRGGMAVVWLAERADGVVKRSVALKMPMFILQGAGDAERFARERDALAALSHPHVARLYDAGVLPSGQPFIVLEHIEGLPLTAFCDARRLDLRARLRLFLQVLAAVDHAHKHLVVHRDLKPSNILVDGDGQVKLLDFGIAKLLGQPESAAAPTRHGDAALTPLYAAPEQLHSAGISTLTDVYALGLVLHEMLTGTLPYRAAGERATLVEVLEALRHGALPRASQARLEQAAAVARGLATVNRLRRALTGDLDTVVSKALRIVPEERYGSAAHLAEDIRHYLDSQPIAARPPSFLYRARLALSRHRLAASIAAVGVALVIGAAGIAWMQFHESRAHAERTAAVRDFMFEMVNDAEPMEGQEGEVTGRQIVDVAVARARNDFSAQPQLQGELLGELGRMYIRLQAPDAAVPVLRDAVIILQRHAGTSDPELNKSRASLADALLQTGDDVREPRALAAAALAACTAPDRECAKARAYAGNILSQIASREGSADEALAAMRQSASDTAQAFGESDPETAIAFLGLATIARNNGRFEEAGAAMTRAIESARGQPMRAADRLMLERTMAVVDLDLGRYAAARARLESLLQQPAGDGERGLQQRLLANVAAEQGDGTTALAASDAALSLIDPRKTAQVLFARQAHARGLTLTGKFDAALAEFAAVITGLQAAGRPPEGFEVLRARRYRAEALFQAGRNVEALGELRALRSLHAAHAPSAVESGLTLDLLGRAELRAGDAAEARAAHQAARVELRRQLPEVHPYCVLNAALLGAATD